MGPGPRKLGNFKKHFASKKHLDMLKTDEEDASIKELAAEAKVKERRMREEAWLSTWAIEGGSSHYLSSLSSRRALWMNIANMTGQVVDNCAIRFHRSLHCITKLVCLARDCKIFLSMLLWLPVWLC